MSRALGLDFLGKFALDPDLVRDGETVGRVAPALGELDGVDDPLGRELVPLGGFGVSVAEAIERLLASVREVDEVDDTAGHAPPTLDDESHDHYRLMASGVVEGPSGINASIKKIADRAGVRSHVHALRAAFAVRMDEQYPGRLVAVKELLGTPGLRRRWCTSAGRTSAAKWKPSGACRGVPCFRPMLVCPQRDSNQTP